jgi:hypothetical protein
VRPGWDIGYLAMLRTITIQPLAMIWHSLTMTAHSRRMSSLNYISHPCPDELDSHMEEVDGKGHPFLTFTTAKYRLN